MSSSQCLIIVANIYRALTLGPNTVSKGYFIQSSSQPHKGGPVKISVLQVKKLKHRTPELSAKTQS